MFTGIIEEKGKIKKMETVSEHAVQLSIETEKITEGMKIGDSISVNGICLTVTQFESGIFEVDAMPETIKATSLKSLTSGSEVNLERAMASDGRFGGHFISGHVDGIGEIIRIRTEENAINYDIKIPPEYSHYLLFKGSIAVDGISLTIFDVEESIFTISLIPHTVAETILGGKREGDIVNIEYDMLAKHVENMLKNTALKHVK